MAARFSLIWDLVLVFFSIPICFAGPLPPSSLRSEYLKNPQAVDVPLPRFAWVLNHSERAESQQAYAIQVARNARFAKELVWDSGRIDSSESTQIAYAGKPLTSDTDYFWRVRYWDRSGNASPWSETATFSTGVLTPADWSAKWITGGRLLRDTFDVAKPVRRARLFIGVAGYYELHVNGKKVGDRVLDPAWTDYGKRTLYSTYDLGPDLLRGKNTIAVLLGRSWYSKSTGVEPKLICELRGTYEDSTTFSVISDSGWQTLKSPITLDDIYDGETYDGRLAVPDWDTNDCSDHGTPAKLADSWSPRMSSQMMPPVKVVDTLTPHKMMEAAPGVYVYDFGQNLSGWVRIKVQGASGTKVRIRYAELADPDGTIRVDNLRSARSTDTYILRGDPNGEEYEAHFTYHGFRYAEVSGFPGVPTLDSVRAREVHSAVETIGNFSSSLSMLNGIQHMFVWSIKTNLVSIPTDCDQRDERLGWMGDAHLSAETAIMNFDMAAFYTNFLRDIRDAQGDGGEVPDIVPYIRMFGLNREGDPAWGLAYPLIVEYMYEYYGDRRILEQHYEGIKAWTEFLHRHAPSGILDYSKFGDWVAIDPSSKILAGTWAYIKSLSAVTMAAKVLGKTEDEAHYRDLTNSVREAFVRRFANAQGVYDTGSQAAQVLALDAHAMPSQAEGPTMNQLLDDLNYYHNVHLTTGILATKYLFPVLASHGHADLAYEVLTQPDYPGYGFMLARGATTLWELWQERTGPEMNSHDHHMFASAGTFLYNTLAGINRGQGVAFESVRIEPQLVHGLSWASASTQTIRGQVSSAWARIGAGYELKVRIPVGSTASVHFPLLKLEDPALVESGKRVWLNGMPAQTPVPGITSVTRMGGDVVCQIGSGNYVFRMQEREQLGSE
ncbi:MAG: family 78 glycoside hydrolase catalytic domain [Acidobacteriaceae bacterium]|nr:family 78 glycoside hydrolase catalytic domain [Acidobacteriaceae bacterium]